MNQILVSARTPEANPELYRIPGPARKSDQRRKSDQSQLDTSMKRPSTLAVTPRPRPNANAKGPDPGRNPAKVSPMMGAPAPKFPSVAENGVQASGNSSMSLIPHHPASARFHPGYGVPATSHAATPYPPMNNAWFLNPTAGARMPGTNTQSAHANNSSKSLFMPTPSPMGPAAPRAYRGAGNPRPALQNQASLLDQNMGEADDCHDPLMRYSPKKDPGQFEFRHFLP